MGLLDFFGRKSGTRSLEKHAKRAADKRAQGPDRWGSLHALSEMKSAEAVDALLQRFTFRVDPSITDQEEKELAFQGILAAGEVAVAPVRAYLQEADAIAWPVRILDELEGEEAVVEALIGLLADMDTEYERDPQRKVDALAQLEARQDPRVAEAVSPFLEDVNETVRFHAAGAILAQEDAEENKDRLIELLATDEGTRVRASVLDAFIERDWGLGDRAKEVQPNLPPGYVLDGSSIRKR
jgi:thioredoxin-like negative regulator of GroEL